MQSLFQHFRYAILFFIYFEFLAHVVCMVEGRVHRIHFVVLQNTQKPAKISFDIRPFHYFFYIYKATRKKSNHYEMSLDSEWTTNKSRIEFELLLQRQNLQIIYIFFVI